MPQRFLRPGIANSKLWNRVSWKAQSLFIRLLTLVDDFGRFDGRPAVICGAIFCVWNEYNEDDVVNPQESAALLAQLAARGLVTWYEVDDVKVVEISQWNERARSNRSKYPEKTELAKDCWQPDNIPQRIDNKALPPSPLHPRHCILATASSPLPQPEEPPHAPSSSATTRAVPRDRKKAERLPCDDEWIQSLKTNPAYQGIDVDREFGKMQAWLTTPRGRGRQLTRAFVVNWLNKADRPLQLNGKNGPVRSDGTIGLRQEDLPPIMDFSDEP